MTMTKKDLATCKELLDAIEDNRPKERFVAFDSDGQACIILLFGKNRHCTFLQGHFSKATAAFEAFAQVEELVKKIDEKYADMCPF